MKAIGRSEDNFIVMMTPREIYALCGNKYPVLMQEVDVNKITDVVRAVTQSATLVEHHAAGLRGHVDAITGAAQKICDAVSPAIQNSLRSEEG